MKYTILGIESSCDETALSVICGRAGEPPHILSDIIYSQMDHLEYGGVVPEIAARMHAEKMPILLKNTMEKASIDYCDLSAVAVTSKPGLIGGVIVGLMAAKGIAMAAQKPLIGVNHLEGHALSPKITKKIAFPYLLLLVSGGHCQIIIVYDVGHYECLGQTIDDAAGEAFDKVAKMLNLGFPGGPIVEKRADMGDENAFGLPRPLCKTDTPNFSFSGLKTAVRKILEAGKVTTDMDINDLCASFQKAVKDCFVNRLEIAIKQMKIKTKKETFPLIVAGGVAANQYLRTHLEALAQKYSLSFGAPPMRYCTDNGVMIAYAGLEHFARGHQSGFDIKPLARAPL